MSNNSSVPNGSSTDLFENKIDHSPSLKVFNGEESAISGDEFRSLFQRRHEYARFLLELSTRQQELIAQGEYSGLIDLLLRKQTALDALQGLSQTNPPLLEQWKSHRDSISITLRRECEHWLSVTEQILAQLMELEQTCTSQLQTKQNETQSQLEAVSNTIHVQDAYRQEPVNSRFDRSQ